MNSKRNIWALSLGLLFVVILFSNGIRLMVEWLWYDSLGYLPAFKTVFMAKLTMGLVEGGLMFAFLAANFLFALRQIGDPARLLPPEIAATPFARMVNVGALRRVILAFSLVVSFLSGLAGAGDWETVLRYTHQASFNLADPVFHRDISFYVFSMPFLEKLNNLVWVASMLALIGVGFAYFLKVQNEQLSMKKGRFNVIVVNAITPAARGHLAFIGALLLASLGVGAFLDRYALLYDQGGLFAGPGYSDMNGTLPMLSFKAAAALVSAGLLAAGILLKRYKLMGGAFALIVVVWIGANGYTSFLQRFVVAPNEQAKEEPYLVHHIQATNQAFGLDKVEERNLSDDEELSMADIQNNRATLNNVRLWDHEPLLDTFSQIQEIRTYYEFISVDNDRYKVNGELRQTMLSPRELQKTALPSRTWINERITFTHGYGLTMGPVNRVNEQGLPVLFLKDLPPQTDYNELKISNPEIYYGELVNDYVFVNTNQKEFDYPQGEENIFSDYNGKGGIVLDSFFKRVLFAVYLRDMKILLAEDFNPKTRIMLFRNVRYRVEEIAPFIRYDRDPYLVVNKGRLVWVFDGYTTTNRYPYSTSVQRVGNYMRNPVKAVVDAKDGTVEFFLSDPTDPIIQTYASIFPGMFKPLSQLPDGLREHLRHPADLFSVQTYMYATYHMLEPSTFYNKEDQWEVPVIGQKGMEPYYTVMKLPGEKTEEFILMLPFTPRLKDNLAAWMAARSDGENYGKLVVYRFPKQKLVYGPRQMVARINQDPLVSQQLTLWDQSGSSVIRGTLLVIPIEASLVYIQPIYLKATDGKIPELKRVIVGYQNEIAMGVNLEDALDQIFSGKRKSGPSRALIQTSQPEVKPGGNLSRQAMEHYNAMQRAARDGDWARFGQEQQRLGELLRQLSGK